jgi:hypothetical protein
MGFGLDISSNVLNHEDVGGSFGACFLSPFQFAYPYLRIKSCSFQFLKKDGFHLLGVEAVLAPNLVRST